MAGCGVTQRNGFSLVELSIVLVILGLLVGGILAGQSLIRAAELRSVSSDLAKYQTATHAFQDKYMGLPGDIINATAFWGKSSTFCPTDTGTVSSPGTCNGNGDGRLYHNTDGWYAWQQLGMAGLIEGSYAPVGGLPVLTGAGRNVPISRIRNAAYLLIDRDISYYQSKGPVGNAIRLAAYSSVTVSLNEGAITAEEAWNLDTKLDDGRGDRGKVMSVRGYSASNAGSGCMSGELTAASATYSLNDTGTNCYLLYWLN